MTVKRIIIAAIVIGLLCSAAAVFAVEADDIVGDWYTDGRKSIVTIEKSGSTYNGTITWLKEPNDSDGKPKKDVENPNESLRSRTIVGIELLKGFTYDSDKEEWKNGKIYDPESGKTYDCIIKMGDNGNTLDVRGYVGVSLIGRTTTWTRKQ